MQSLRALRAIHLEARVRTKVSIFSSAIGRWRKTPRGSWLLGCKRRNLRFSERRKSVHAFHRRASHRKALQRPMATVAGALDRAQASSRSALRPRRAESIFVVWKVGFVFDADAGIERSLPV